jgi:hypothetical protein
MELATAYEGLPFRETGFQDQRRRHSGTSHHQPDAAKFSCPKPDRLETPAPSVPRIAQSWSHQLHLTPANVLRAAQLIKIGETFEGAFVIYISDNSAQYDPPRLPSDRSVNY